MSLLIFSDKPVITVSPPAFLDFVRILIRMLRPLIEFINSSILKFDLLNQAPLGSAAGSINYDPIKGTMNVRNAFTGSSIQVGQELVNYVINNTGVSIPDGKAVYFSDFDEGNDAFEISLSNAGVQSKAKVKGFTTTTMPNGAFGLITPFGRVNNLNTSTFVGEGGKEVYLSDSSDGDITTTKPPIAIQVGYLGKIHATSGFIEVEIRELEKSIYGEYYHSANQTFTASITTEVLSDSISESSGIIHTLPNIWEFPFTGVYQVSIEPQYNRTAGGGVDVINIFTSIDSGSGFINKTASNIKISVNTSNSTNVSSLTTTFRIENSNDRAKILIQVEDSDLILSAFAASGIAPNDIPFTPSIIVNIFRIGD